MRVLFFCWEFPPRGSGIGSYVAQMSRALTDAGHTVVVATSSGDGLPAREETPCGIIHRCYACEEIGTPVVRDHILHLTREYAVDLVEGVDRLGESASLLREHNRPPVLIKCHYNDVLAAPRYAQAGYAWQRLAIDVACWRVRDRIARERGSIEGADMLVTPCRRMLQEVEQNGGRFPAAML